MPELDDEALVAFDQGDFDHPFIVGFLWNGTDKPPNQDINPSVRRLRTVSGHVLEFDDNGGEERIRVATAGGHKIELKDTPPASVTIRTIGGQEVVLDDSPASISLRTTAGNSIEISDAPPGIAVTVPSGTVTVQCVQANVNASAMLSVTAPLAQFSGVVQATSIVGASYTPAPGNTFGL